MKWHTFAASFDDRAFASVQLEVNIPRDIVINVYMRTHADDPLLTMTHEKERENSMSQKEE